MGAESINDALKARPIRVKKEGGIRNDENNCNKVCRVNNKMYLRGMETKGQVEKISKAETTEKKAQKVSVSYTLRSFKDNIKKLEDLGLLGAEEVAKGKELHGAAMKKHLGDW